MRNQHPESLSGCCKDTLLFRVRAFTKSVNQVKVLLYMPVYDMLYLVMRICVQEQYLHEDRISHISRVNFLNIPPLAEITKSWNDICLFIKAFVDPASDLYQMK